MDRTCTLGWRSYVVHLPPDYSPGTAYPVVVGFHGGSGRASAFMNLSLLPGAADDAGYVAVFPNGTGLFGLLTWNAGNCCGYAVNHDVDDVGFFRRMVADWKGKFSFDPKRVYLTGMSNGSIMAYRLACECADLVAAVAPVAGGLGVEGPAPTRPVPALHFHGLQDPDYPYWGGPTVSAGTTVNFTGVLDTLGQFANWYGCPPPVDRDDGPDVKVTEWPDPAGQADSPPLLSLYTLAQCGHQWPGGTAGPVSSMGPYVATPQASPLMLEWFRNWSL